MEAVEELDSKEVILIFPSQRKNNKTVRVLKTPKTDTSERKVYIPGFVAQCLIDIKKEQDEVKEALGSEYTDYNLIMATTFGMQREWKMPFIIRKILIRIYMSRKRKKIRLPYRRE